MAKNFVDEGISVSYKNAGSGIVYSGSVVSMDAVIGVALGDIPVGESGTVRIVGVFKLPKASGAAMAVGAEVFWDEDVKKIVDMQNANTVIAGVVTADAVANAATVNVKINA